MIIAKTGMKKIPEGCKKCAYSMVEHYGLGNTFRVCRIRWRACPTEKKTSGNVGYGRPSWCPLVDEMEV